MTSFNLFEQLLRETESIVDLDQRHFPGGQHSQNLLAKCLEQLLKKDRINLFKRLTHLIAAAHRQNVDIGMLFFVCPATQSHLRGLFNDQAGGVTNSEPGGISVAYADGSTFEIQSNALVYLILAGNIVAELLGFTEFMACAQRIAKAGNNRSQVDAVATDWSNAFDKYRQQRGGSSQHERQFKAIIDFLNRQFGPGEFTYLDIQSPHVLLFWIDHSGNKNLSLQRYYKVHQRFVDFVDQFASTVRVQTMSDATPSTMEVDDYLDLFAAREETAHHGCTPMDDWLALFSDHTEIKFLKNIELQQVAYLTELPTCASQLGVSALRAYCFSPLENKLIQLRRQQASAVQIQDFLLPDAANYYAKKYMMALEEFSHIIDSFRNSCLASAHILLSNQRHEGIRLLYTLCSDLDGEQGFCRDFTLMGISPNGFRMEFAEGHDFFEQGAQVFFAKLAQEESPEKLRLAIRRCQDAWETINQAGFSPKHKNSPSFVNLFALAAERMPNALFHLRAVRKRLISQVRDFDLQMQHDFAIILNTFTGIYLSPCHSEDVV